jgi:predicted dehydrogenase
MTDRSAGGGVLAETGSHLIDQLLYVLDADSVSLDGASRRINYGLELASSLVVKVTTASGTAVECGIEVSLLEDLCNGVFVEFPSYMLRIGLAFDDTLTLVSKLGGHSAELVMSEGADSAVQGFCLEWRDFLNQCRSGEPSAIDARTVRSTTALIEAGAHWRVHTPAVADDPYSESSVMEEVPR